MALGAAALGAAAATARAAGYGISAGARQVALAEAPAAAAAASTTLAAAAAQAEVFSLSTHARRLYARLRRLMHLTARGAYLAALFFPLGLLAVPCCVWLSELGGTETWAYMLLHALRNAGPVWIKWGQWAASRPDIFPAPIRRRLEELHDAAPTHDFRATRRVMEEAYGVPLEHIFEHFDETPVASGSIGQVYRAVLREDVARRAAVEDMAAYAAERTLFQRAWDWVLGGAGDGVADPDEREVAVKVRHPWVVDNLESDCRLLNELVRLVSRVRPKECARLGETTQHFEAALAQQLDFQEEASELNAFRRNFRRWRNVTFPRPLRTLSSKAVLVETFEKAVPIKEYIEQPGHPINAAIARLGLSCLLKMMLVDNHMHADLHPGNIMVRERRWGLPPNIVLLDTGMTVELSSDDRYSLLDMLTGISDMDPDRVVDGAMRFSCPIPEQTQSEFRAEIRHIFGTIENAWVTTKKARAAAMGIDYAPMKLADAAPGDGAEDTVNGLQHMGAIMTKVFECCRQYGVQLEGRICTVLVTTVMLESLQHQLDPTVGIMKSLDGALTKAGVARVFPFLTWWVDMAMDKVPKDFLPKADTPPPALAAA